MIILLTINKIAIVYDFVLLVVIQKLEKMQQRLKLLVGVFLCWLGVHYTQAQDIQTYYADPTDTLHRFYTIVKPKKSIQAWLLLLPGFGETPQSVLRETNLPIIAAEHGILVVIPVLSAGSNHFFIDQQAQQDIDELLGKLSKTLLLATKPFFIGGFSMGGSAAVKYAIRAAQTQGLLQPRAVVGIDPPLDFDRFYFSVENTIHVSPSALASEEAKWLLSKLETTFGGTPSQVPERYAALSCFVYRQHDFSQLAYLKNTPIRLYAEPAIAWQMQERNRNLYDLNLTDCVAMINTLRLQGSTKAELILTNDKGWRKQQNVRNPHSWSIGEPRRLVAWLLGQLPTP